VKTLVDYSLFNNSKLLKSAFTFLLFVLIVGFGASILGINTFPTLLIFYFFGINLIASLNNSKPYLTPLLLILSLLVLMGATNNDNGVNGDYYAYNDLYSHFKTGGTIENITGYKTDLGYMVLMDFFASSNIPYNIFITFVAIIGLLLIRSTVMKLTNHYSLILVCYSLFPFFYDVYQIRYFLAYSIIVYALQYIIFFENKSYLKYSILVIFSALFHSSTILFLLYLLITLKIKSILKFLFAISIFVSLGSLLFSINAVNYIVSIVQISKLETYTSAALNYKLNPLTSLSIILFISFFIWITNKINKNDNTYTTNRILWMNLLNILLLPLLFVSLDFERFIRPILIINYAIISVYLLKQPLKYRCVLFLLLILVVFFRQYMMFGFSQAVFENNNILQLLNTFFE